MCELDNSACQLPCNSLVIELVRTVKLNTGYGIKQYNQTDILSRKNYPGLAVGETTNGLTRYLELSLAEIVNDIKP